MALYVTGPVSLFVGVPQQLAQLIPFPALYGQPEFPPGTSPAPATGPFLLVPAGADPFASSFPNPADAGILNTLRNWVPYWLGTGQQAPDIDITPAFSEHHTNEGGTEIPAERIYEGKRAVVEVTLNNYAEAVLAFTESTAAAGVFAQPPLNVSAGRGIDLEGYVGTAMQAEGATWPLWLVFPYVQKPIYRAFGMVPGYRFFSASLANSRHSTGTRAKAVRCLFDCQRLDIGGAWCLYDHNVTGLSTPQLF